MNVLTENKHSVEAQNELCSHCGLDCSDGTVKMNSLNFCCNGCATVYQLLSDNSLDQYYRIENTPGNQPPLKDEFSFVDEPEVFESLISFKNEKQAAVLLKIPGIHCSSCIWLLEKLYRLDHGILKSTVNFMKKELTVHFDLDKIKLSEIIQLLSSLGYAPSLTLNAVAENRQKPSNKAALKIAVAGFCFGNIMLFTFPFYFGLKDGRMYEYFSWLNAALAIPVFTWCAADYWKASWNGIAKRAVTLDLPVTAGIAAMTFQSYFEVFSGSGEGYFDSLSGLLFFLLTGKYFQNKVYENLSFDRDYRSFFPLWSNKITAGKISKCPVGNLVPGDRIRVRNEELIPCDSILASSEALINYSFVTGESETVAVTAGEKIYAGGKISGRPADFDILKPCSSSYLTGLWDKTAEDKFSPFADRISRYFLTITFSLATIFGLSWLETGTSEALSVFTAVLIIACPCALALSAPFTYGFAGRFLNRCHLYLKNNGIIEKLADCRSVVFDKTGTLSSNENSHYEFNGNLTEQEQFAVKAVAGCSTHPISQMIFNAMGGRAITAPDSFEEFSGRGIKGTVANFSVEIGSETFIDAPKPGTWVKINGKLKGSWKFKKKYRKGLKDALTAISKGRELAVLSGDNSKEQKQLEEIFPTGTEMVFNQLPVQKKDFITAKQKKQPVLMIGDGLNDAGALSEASAGIAVTEDFSRFFPACDGILDAANLGSIDAILKYSLWCKRVIRCNFIFSLLYNVTGLYLAACGFLKPVICAVLMPASSITIILLSAFGTWLGAQKYLNKENV